MGDESTIYITERWKDMYCTSNERKECSISIDVFSFEKK